MLDKLTNAISRKLATHKEAVLAQRAAIERELTGDDARGHAGTILKNPEGYSTSLRTTAENAQKEYARLRREWESQGIPLMTLAASLMIARERRDEAVAAWREQEDVEAARRYTKVHPDVRVLFDRLFEHGVKPRHLNLRPETIAIIADLIRWDGADPEWQDEQSPVPDVYRIYASRLVLTPGQMTDTQRSTPGTPSVRTSELDPRYYMFADVIARLSHAVGPAGLEPATQPPPVPPPANGIIDCSVYAEDAVEVSDAEPTDGPETLTPARARVWAEIIYDRIPSMLGVYWPPTGVERDDFNPSRLLPALDAWIASGKAWGGAERFRAAVERGEGQRFMATAREIGVEGLTARLLAGDHRAMEQAKGLGLHKRADFDVDNITAATHY